ncbi:MAG TPA: formyltransferase family protein [Candidatus Baltobacteraceae bacterium]|nr:formyltransferase family protein [Candidatus Baltobacteraceae bacterium]
MLRSVFVGFDNDLNRLFAHWMAQNSNLVGCVWIPSTTQWLTSKKGKVDFLRQRLKKRGLFKTIDEVLFFLLYHSNEKTNANTRAASALVKEYWDNADFNGWGAFFPTRAINDPMVIRYVQGLQPDIIVSHCIHQYFGKKLREIPRLGAYLLHIGILPEYRGLYSPFWTMHNADFENFGYTLFRLSDGLDAGEAYVQGRLSNVDIARDNHILIEYKAVLASLPPIAQFFSDLENGTAAPIERANAVPGYYSYPGLTDYIRQRIRVGRALRDRDRASTPQQSQTV